MQYLLTEAEYEKLQAAAKELKLTHEKALQAFCTRVANELPVDWGWTGGDPKKPWGCILTRDWLWRACFVAAVLFKARQRCAHKVMDPVFGEWCIYCDSGMST